MRDLQITVGALNSECHYFDFWMFMPGTNSGYLGKSHFADLPTPQVKQSPPTITRCQPFTALGRNQ